MPQAPLDVIILAAGKGSRMKSNTPKVLHKVAGFSLLEHVIRATLAVNPNKIHVVIGHGKEQIKQAFADSAYTEQLNWVEQLEQLGTGHAVQQALPFVDDASNVLMLTADVPLIQSSTLEKIDQSMQAFPLTLLTAIVSDPTGLGRIMRQGDEVTGIVEHKDCSAEQLQIDEINSGIMCAQAKQLKTWLSQLNNNNAQQEYYLTDIVQIASEAGNPIAAVHPKNETEVMGINFRKQLAEVECIYQHQQADKLMEQGVTIIDPHRIDIRGDVTIGQDCELDINTVIQGPTSIGNNVKIAPNCVITASTIGDNTEIHANTVIEQATIANDVNIGPFARIRPGTELSQQVRIGNFVETKNAKLGEGSKVNHLSYVGDSRVGNDTNIGAGVITCNYDGANKHLTKIGNNVFVGSNAQLVAPVEIADGATIAAGSTITNKVDQNQLAIARSKQRQIDNWQRPQKADKKDKN